MKLKEAVQNKAGKVQILRLTSRDHPAPPSEFLDSAGKDPKKICCRLPQDLTVK
jgi:DNA polymerase/3'-5' exonuclease PolX